MVTNFIAVSAITKAVILDYQASMNQYLDYVTTNGYCHQVPEQRNTLGVVAKLLGHSTTRITQHYAKLLKDNILNEVKDAFEKSH